MHHFVHQQSRILYALASTPVRAILAPTLVLMLFALARASEIQIFFQNALRL